MSQRIASIAAILNEDSESTDSEEYLSVPTGVTPVTKSSVRERHADVETRERTKSSPCSSSAKEDPLNTQSVKKRAEVDLDSKRNIPSSATQQKPTTSRNKNGSQEVSDFNVKRTEHDEYNFDGEQFPEISPVRDEVSAPSMNNSLQEETPEKRIVETLLRGKQPTSHLMNSEWMEKSQPNRIKVINSPGSKTLNTKDTTEEWSGSKSNKNGLANNSRSTFQYSTERSMNQHANLNQFLAHQTPSKVMATTHKKIHTQQYRDGSTTVGEILDPKQRNTTSTDRRPTKEDHGQEVSRYHSIPNYDNDPQMRSTQNPLSVHERSLYKKAHLIEQFNEKFGAHFMTVAYRNSAPNTPSAESGADKSFARSLPQNVSSPSIMYGTQNSHHVVHENLKERLIAENRRLTLEIGELTAELAACRSQSENKSSRLALAREAQWSYQAQELQNENNILKAQVDELNGHYTRMKGQVEAVTRELRTAREHMNTSQIQIETLEARIQDREMALSSESANCGRLRADLRDRTSELGRLRVEKETQHRESDNRIRELTELLDEANRQRINFIETAEKHDRERTELLSAKQELVNQLRVAQVELHRYQNSQGTELEKLRQTLRKVQLDKDEMEAALESTTKTLDRVGEVEKTHREEIKRLKETRSLMESRISELQGEVERSSVYYNQLVELNEENQRLAQECDRAVLVRQEMHKECERLRTELKELHQIVASTTKKHLSQTMGNVTSVQKSPGSTANHYPWSNGM